MPRITKGEADGDDPAIAQGIRQDIVRSPKQAAQRLDQNERKSAERNSCDAGDNDHIADCLRRFFRLFSPQTEAVYGCQAVPQQAGQGNGDRSDRRDDVGRAIAEIADAVTDEYLVNDIIQ